MTECPICLEEIQKKAVLSCKHEMCSVCIIKWLNEDHSCPICRAEVDVRSRSFRVILNKLSMQELSEIIENINRDNLGLVTRNEVYVRRPTITRRGRRQNFICVNTAMEAREENIEIMKMTIALLGVCIIFLVILITTR